MIKFSRSFKLNEIHRVDSPFNEDPKNIIFFQGGPNFGKGWPEKLGKMGNNRTSIVIQIGGLKNFKEAYQPRSSGTKILVMPKFSYMLDQFLEKIKKSQNLTLFSVLPSQNIRTYSKIFIWPNVFGYRPGITKISLKKSQLVFELSRKNLRRSK